MHREDMEYKEADQLYHSKSVVGQNEDSLLDSRSMTTRMAVNPAEAGSCSMRSINMESQGHAGTGSGLVHRVCANKA